MTEKTTQILNNHTRTNNLPQPHQEFLQGFLEHKELRGKEKRTLEAYRNHLLGLLTWLNKHNTNPADITTNQALEYHNHVTQNLADSTRRNRIIYIRDAYDTLTDIEPNPFIEAEALLPSQVEASQNSQRPISINDMAAFVQQLKHPQWQAIIMTLATTGIRIGELANIKLNDVNLEDPSVLEQFDQHNIELEQPNHPDSLHIPHNRAGNKRKINTIIPLTKQTKATLIRWLAIRLNINTNSDYLFVSLADNWGAQHSPSSLHDKITNRTANYGWHNGEGSKENVSPHYFRHWATTQLQHDRDTDEHLVKYIRGDNNGEALTHYTHHWFKDTAPIVRNAIPDLF